MIDLRDKKIGLVLSGGGAKGAYQVGLFRALDECGLLDRVTVMSGCSIGAYAETILAIRGIDEYRRFLYEFQGMFFSGESVSEETVAEAKALVASGKAGIEELCNDRRFWRFDGAGLTEYIRELVSGGAVEKSGKRLYVCGYSLEKRRPVYFRLNDLSDEEKVRAIIGSGSLQYLLKPSLLRGHHLNDGGLVPDICVDGGAPADKIPLLPVASEDVDFILVNFLIAADRVNTSLVSSAVDYMELRPSSPLEAFPGAGTLDFSREKLESHEKKGYADAIGLIKENFIF